MQDYNFVNGKKGKIKQFLDSQNAMNAQNAVNSGNFKDKQLSNESNSSLLLSDVMPKIGQSILDISISQNLISKKHKNKSNS